MIQVEHLERGYGGRRVLDGVTFEVAAGESVVIIGRSGGGKSVLLRHLIGLLQPEAGRVMIEGEDLGRMSERELLRVRRKFGMLFQGAALFDSLTVEENVGFALRRQGKRSGGEIAREVSRVLELVDLAGTEKKKPVELSGGMRKRVGLARAIVYEPQILLYDEPTTGLDPIVSDSIDQLIIRVREELHVTSVAVTHDMRSARRIGQRLLMLHEGRIHASGRPEEIFASTDPVLYNFINGISKERQEVGT